ncbi:MAG: J domain-containing protein [Candidatus Melainabacteria bacterium]|nr:J domain-containing protein [Candidatus Melainabacteria bacterium]
MPAMNFEACYAALELPFGAGLKAVNERWRKLSQIHHPDRHARNPKNYQIALEKQKQLNNARDILKKWFETNPNVTPPRSTSGSQQKTHTQNKSADANASSNNNTNRSQSNPTNSHTKENTQDKQQAHANYSHQQTKTRATGSSSRQGASAKSAPNTGWFSASELKLTPLQELVRSVDKHCSGSEPSFLAMILGFAALFGPLFVISGTLGAIFPELPGHYPDWLMMTMLGASGWCTWYIFRWFFAESELIKLQQKELYFKSNRTMADTLELAKTIIRKHSRPNSEWKFMSNETSQEATIEFVEEVFPELTRVRNVVIRFEARPAKHAVVLAMEVKVKSPINSFSCKQIAEAVVAELKKEFQELAA